MELISFSIRTATFDGSFCQGYFGPEIRELTCSKWKRCAMRVIRRKTRRPIIFEFQKNPGKDSRHGQKSKIN